MSSSYHGRGGGEYFENYVKENVPFSSFLCFTQGQRPVVMRAIIEKVLTIALEASH